MASEEEPQTTSSTLSFILVNLLVVFALVGFCFLFGLGRIFSDWCGNRVDYEVVSPDKQLKAVQFTRDCGATTSLSSQISILNQGTALPNESGNVFVSEGGIAKVRWINNRKLAIDYYESCQVFHKETSILVPGRFILTGEYSWSGRGTPVDTEEVVTFPSSRYSKMSTAPGPHQLPCVRSTDAESKLNFFLTS